MKLSRNEVLASYAPQLFKKTYQVEIFDKDELLCSYTFKNKKKIVFFVQELDKDFFKKFCIIKNEMKADKIVVYCEFAYLICPGTLEIILNRDTGLEAIN